jgi:hypothetical protein
MTEAAPLPYTPIDERESGYTAVELAAETLGKDLCANLWDLLLQQKKPLADLSPIEQEGHLIRLRDRTKTLVRQALEILTAGEYPACAAILAGISISDEITVKLVIPANAPGRHELIDRRKQPVVLVMANPEEYAARMEEVKARSAQGELFTLKEDAVRKSLENVEVTDPMIVDGLFMQGVLDVRPPVWSKLNDDLRHAARAFYLELDRNPKATMPDVLLPYRIIAGDGAPPTSSDSAG